MHTNVSTSTDNKQPGGVREISNRQNTGSLFESPLQWWYRLAAPTEPPNATPRDRERVRAGQLSSIILLIMLLFGISQLPGAISSGNSTFLLILLVSMSIHLCTFVLNKQGKVYTTGAILVAITEIGFILIVLTVFTPLSARSITVFYLIVITELMAVSLLPPKSVFIALLCNALFTWVMITFLRANDFKIASATAYYTVLIGPLILQIITALITYLWASGARQAIERVERIAALERVLAERDRAEAEQKQQLEQGIQQILQTHVQAANGNFEARAPLAKDNVLWQVAYSLNNLLARLQRTTQSEHELQRTKNEVGRLTETVRQAKGRRYPLQLSKTGTVLDPLAQELNGTYIDQR